MLSRVYTMYNSLAQAKEKAFKPDLSLKGIKIEDDRIDDKRVSGMRNEHKIFFTEFLKKIFNASGVGRSPNSQMKF